MSKKSSVHKEEKGLPEEPHLPEPTDVEGIIIEEVEILEVTEVHLFEEELEDEEFDSIFNGSKSKKPTTEEEEDVEDFNSYFFEE